MMKKLFLITLLLAMGSLARGQMFPERKEVRKGNKYYERENYVESEAAYRGALSKNPLSYEGNFNLGNSFYRQGRYEEAAERFLQLGQVPHLPHIQAETYYNAGNALVQQYKEEYDQQKLEDALEIYKQSLRLNPEDQQVKFNLAYVQKLLERDNDGDGGGGDDSEDQNQDQPGDGDQNPDGDPDRNDDSDPDHPEGEDPNEPNPDSDGPQQDRPEDQRPEPRMSPEEAQQMLNAMQNNEESAREKMEAQPAGAVGASGKNW